LEAEGFVVGIKFPASTRLRWKPARRQFLATATWCVPGEPRAGFCASQP
jgi:hypothetical protein